MALSRWLLLFSCWVVSDSWWPHELQHARLPCPSLSPGIEITFICVPGPYSFLQLHSCFLNCPLHISTRMAHSPCELKIHSNKYFLVPILSPCPLQSAFLQEPLFHYTPCTTTRKPSGHPWLLMCLLTVQNT